MSPFCQSLKRLYDSSKITIQKLDDLKLANKLTQEEYNFITN